MYVKNFVSFWLISQKKYILRGFVYGRGTLEESKKNSPLVKKFRFLCLFFCCEDDRNFFVKQVDLLWTSFWQDTNIFNILPNIKIKFCVRTESLGGSAKNSQFGSCNVNFNVQICRLQNRNSIAKYTDNCKRTGLPRHDATKRCGCSY